MNCKQKNCEEEARFMVYWATDRVPSCEIHAKQLQGLARAMGMPNPQINSIVADGLEAPAEQTPQEGEV